MSATFFAVSATILYTSDYNDQLIACLNSIGTSYVKPEEALIWKKVKLKTSCGVIVLARQSVVPGSAIALRILKIQHLLKSKYGDGDLVHTIIRRLALIDDSISVVFEPDLIADDNRLPLLQSIVAAANGILFDGTDLFYPSFERIEFNRS